MIVSKKTICQRCKSEFFRGCVRITVLNYCDSCTKDVIEGNVPDEEFFNTLTEALTKLSGNSTFLSEYLEVPVSLIQHWNDGNPPHQHSKRLVFEKLKLLMSFKDPNEMICLAIGNR